MMSAQQFILIGHPVSHSVSPQIHGAAYRECVLPHRYEAVDCPDAQAVEVQIERLRQGQLAGANVTVPHKRLALSLADELDPSARDTGAANVLVCTLEGRVKAYNTDQGALSELLQAGARRGMQQVVVLGNGGAGLAAAVAARRGGATRVSVSARRWQGAKDSWPDRAQFEALGCETHTWDTTGDLALAFSDADVIVQATSAGMKGVGSGETIVDIIPWKQLRRDVFIYDVVYNPPVTPLLARAKEEGLSAEGGLSMLVGQAALALRIWLGVEPPVQAMRDAAERALFGAHP